MTNHIDTYETEEPVNMQRAFVAETTLHDYAENKGEGKLEKYDYRSAIVDLLSDLRHLCEVEEIDFHKACDVSYVHCLEERKAL